MTSYYDTDDYNEIVERQANEIMDAYLSGELSADRYLYEAGNTNLRFRIMQVDSTGHLGSIVADTFDAAQTQFGCWYVFLEHAGTRYAQVMSRTLGAKDNVSSTVISYADSAALRDARMEAILTLSERQAGLFNEVVYDALPVYQLELRVTDPITVDAYYSGGLKDNYQSFNFLYAGRWVFPAVLAACALLALVCAVQLFAGTGRLAGREGVTFTWFDRIPMELSFAGLVLLDVVVTLLMWNGVPALLRDAFYWVAIPDLAVSVLGIAALALVFTLWADSALAWLLAFARAAKSGQAFRNFGTVRAAKWLAGALRLLPLVPKVAAGIVGFTAISLFLVRVALGGSYLRISWEVKLFCFTPLALLWLAAAGYLLYGAAAIKKLDEGARRIAQGHYDATIDTAGMSRHLCRHAETLQNIAAGLNDAVEERTKSERMKTELITNVSHDLKTPLTSIINYTDLLRSQPLPEKAAEYAEVLARQSARLKKLTEDLVEASKASSGAMPCEKRPTDLAELCEQALGEYAARLDGAGLAPVLQMPADGLWANVDGRLVWRVLDNLLGNACKYAMPGTRLYLTGWLEGAGPAPAAVLALKNVSREPLNVSAEELTARFVRGDASRSTEGSGLGLSIAQSLCELQGGQFCLTVDGDLFKAELRLEPCAAPAAPAPDEAADEPERLPAGPDAAAAP